MDSIQLTEQQRQIIDAEMQRVMALRQHANAEGQRLDNMIALIFPQWLEGKHSYKDGVFALLPERKQEGSDGA